MEDLVKEIKQIALLENEIGLLVRKIDFIEMEKQVRDDYCLFSIDQYLSYLKQKIEVQEDMLEALREEVLSIYSLTQLYIAYEQLSLQEYVNDKLDIIFVIFDLIDRKEMSIERGR